MNYLNKSIKSALACLIILLLGSLISCGGSGADDGSTAQDLAIAKQSPGPGSGGPGGGGSTTTQLDSATTTQVFDTSFAVEFSYSCLSGGCHETDQKLVDEYAASKMTHTMVKCNACHGTHTADTLGLDKPNLTGYYPGIGATGYKVDTDRCKVCHNNEHGDGGNKNQVIIAMVVMPLMSSELASLEVGSRTMHEDPDLAWIFYRLLKW